MKNNELIPFQGTQIPYVVQNDKIWIAIRPIATAIGINVDAALRGVKNDEILSELHTEQYVVANDGKERLMLCLPLDYLPGWLFSIDHNKANHQARENLLLYKRECYQALHSHFFGKHKVVEGNMRRIQRLNWELQELSSKMKDVRKEIKELEASNIQAYQLSEKERTPHASQA